ncbi:MAG: sigma-70 family RNA polymerase sigma factor [Planctomycetes bacterium]|nr:sigma-70 family RNA polymerase sigma factor [Planctomycetota bacterium]
MKWEGKCTVQDCNKDFGGDAGPMGRRAQETPLMQVFLREQECLRRIAAGMGMSGADAEDVLQDVSLQVLKYTDRITQEDEMMPWLVRTTVNHCLSEHRRRFRRKASRILQRRPDLSRVLAEEGRAVEQAGLSEELEVIRRALLELDPSLLLVVVLRYFCDLDSTAIAAIVETNASTVRSRLREARLLLAGKLMQRGIEP